jgi:predicted phosphohydrolase
MAIYTIADLHLSINDQTNKSMEVFGSRWNGYVEKLENHWRSTVKSEDTVIIPGDISWALALEEARQDLCFLETLPGNKLIGKGNHDFWWSTASKINAFFKENDIHTILLLHNNAYKIENKIICGTRGWFTDDSQQQTVSQTDYTKIVNREVIRLELSLNQGVALQNKDEPEEILVFLHFPPVWGNFICEEIVSTLQKYGVKNCYFGHIHGGYNLPSVLYYNDIRFVRISADYLSFLPYPIK